ncbi:MAG: hypothetical protein LC662_12730 [Rhodothermaceae bacterium]|nr:hypothetical protein [Rhodothermaceae bacterium]
MAIILFILFMAVLPEPPCPEITVEGGIIFVGNEPFAVPALYDENDKRYFLSVSEKVKKDMALNAGKKAVVTGRLYEDDWSGKRVLFIRVTTYQWIDNDQ